MQKNNFLIFITILLSISSGFLLGYLIKDHLFEQTGNNKMPETNQKLEEVNCNSEIQEFMNQKLRKNWGRFYRSTEPITLVTLDFYGNLLIDDVVYARYTDITKNEDGSYTWGVYNPFINFTAKPITYYPSGVEIYQDGEHIKTGIIVDRFSFDSEIYSKSVLDQADLEGMPY